MSFDDLISAPVVRDSQTVQVAISGELVTFKFTASPPELWTEATASSPLRAAVPLDRNYGYNLHGACVLIAPYAGVRLEGDAEIPLTENQWTMVFERLSGHDFARIVDAIWTLNEYGPQQLVSSLKKASAATPGSDPK